MYIYILYIYYIYTIYIYRNFAVYTRTIGIFTNLKQAKIKCCLDFKQFPFIQILAAEQLFE